MHSALGRVFVVALLVIAAALPLAAAQQRGRNAFVSSWQNRAVVLQQPLYSLLYDERSRVMPLIRRESRVSGLTVATANGTFYQFEARRDSEDDVVELDPYRVLTRLEGQYRRSKHLDIGTVQDIEPLMIVAYERGVEMVVSRVQIERDYVRLSLSKERGSDLATTLTVKWMTPLSKELSESALLDEVLQRFLARPN